MANGYIALVKQSYSRVSLLVLGMLAVLFATQALGQALDWNRDLYYEKGSVVFFLGSEFTAQSGNRNVEPTLSTEIWKKTGEVIATSRASRIPGWSPATLYDIPQLTVAHKGRIWRNISRTINEEPGKFGINVWQSIGLDFNTPPVFSVNEFYELGNVVLYQGGLWQATLNQRGEVPSQSSAWVLLGYTSGQGSNEDSFNNAIQGNSDAMGNTWDRQSAYPVAGSVVTYHGILWRNSAPAATGEEPGAEGVNTWYMVGLEREEMLPEWNQSQSYAQSQAVKYGQYIWISRRLTSSVAPGQSVDWLLVGTIATKTLAWDFGKWYPQGSTVAYLGNRWFALRDTQAERPGDSTTGDKWVLFEEQRLSGFISVRNWRAGDAYPMIGMIVKYLERDWVNLRPVLFDGTMPPSSNAWELLNKKDSGTSAALGAAVSETDVQWQQARNYNIIGTVVTFNGLKYRSLIEVTGGNPPPYNQQAWQLLSDLKTAGTTLMPLTTEAKSSAEWNPQTIYDTRGAVVRYMGQDWTNSYWTQKDVPGESLVWQPLVIADEAAWNRYIIYDNTRTYTVLYKAKLYKNQHRTQGDEPGVSSAWMEVTSYADINGADWSATSQYTAPRMKAKHNGRTWYNLWPTTGQEPGASGVWQPETLLDEEPWSQFVIYDYKSRGEPERNYRVTYQGRVWVQSWWTQGDTPGVNDAWKPYVANTTHVNGNEWQAERIYSSPNMIVTWPATGSTREWYNRFSTKGDTPGQNPVWQPVTILDGEAWNTNVIYDASARGESKRNYVVTYNGQRWTNQWYSQGDQPGVSSVWQSLDKKP